MKIEILTIFPRLFDAFVSESLIGKAVEQGLLSFTITDIRSFAALPHRSVDDAPYGGGAGMVMKPEPLAAAIAEAKSRLPRAKVILLSASGKLFSQEFAHSFSSLEEIILICGRYEGIDQRVIDAYVDLEISLGNYVLMGGEIPAMTVIEATTRLIPGVIGNPESLTTESFASINSLLEAPHYTRPPLFEGRAVPEVLTSGDHKKIAIWRASEGAKKTAENRPELLISKPKKEII